MKSLILPGGTAAIIVAGAIGLGPALAAAEGHGTTGYFVAEFQNCNKSDCGWSGNFMTSDGQVTRLNVGFQGPHGTLHAGDRLAALDTGDPSGVYARHGSRDWIGDLAAIVVGAIGFGLWAWRVPYRAARRRAHRDIPLTPD
jgi:hypothetical protein